NAEHHPDPDQRYHYRYQAASLAWESAALLPNNSDETAYVLWQGGTFLKRLEPHIADYFYKTLVMRNRKTALGAEADRQRWLPIIDTNGNILPGKQAKIMPEQEPVAQPSSPVQEEHSKPEPSVEADPTTVSVAGYQYVLHKGDTLVMVLQAYAEAGVSLTMA